MSKPNFWPEPPKKVGNRYEYGSLTFWAEGGGIYVIDSQPKPGEEPRKSIMLPGWQARTMAQLKYYNYVAKDAHVGDPGTVLWKAQHARAIKCLVEAMFEVGRQAVQQGDLSRPEVQEYYRKHVAPVKQTYLIPGIVTPQ